MGKSGLKIYKRTAIRALAMFMVLAILFTGVIPGTGRAAAFDDTEGHEAEAEIERLAAIGLIKGTSATTYSPDSDINRAEFLALVNRLFGAYEMANISQFTDVSINQWYHAEIAKAYQMGTTVGNGNGLMQPLNPVTREQAAIIIARVLCLPAGNNSALFAFEDREDIAAYSRDYVAAMVIEGYMSGRDVNFEPAQNLTRAEAAVILNNIIGDLHSQSGTYSGNCDGNLIITTPNVNIRNALIKGDVIIGDGVGRGEVTLENCTVNGRLIVRGGGENSVYVNNTRVLGDTYVMNTNNSVHIATSGTSFLGRVIANSGMSLSGGGVKSVFIGDKMKGGSSVDLSGCDYESLDIMSPEVVINVSNGSIGNVNFGTNSRGSSLNLASNANVRYMSINAPDINISGRGSVNTADIAASGAVMDMYPGSVTVADSITARLNGSNVSGQPTSPTGSNTDRVKAGVVVDSGFSASIAKASDWSTITISQTNSTIGLEASKNGKNRLAYWVRVFIPAPDETDDSGYATAFTYAQDGGYVTKTYFSLGKQNGKWGIEYYTPVVRNGPSLNGTINDELFIRWNTGHYEKIYLRSKTMTLKAISAAQELELLNLYNKAEFYAYDGTRYSGTEAIRRLLITENALGLDIGAFPSLPDADKQYVSAALNAVRETFVTKDVIQSRIYAEVFGKGALYAVNRAMTIEQIRAVLENKSYADEIGIDISNTSKYMRLSQAGRLAVAGELYGSRGDDYTDIQTVRGIVNAAVDRVWIAENDLLVQINAARTYDEMQKLLENKTNALLLGIVTDAEPYSTLSAETKKAIMTDIFGAKVYSGLEPVRERFEGNIASSLNAEDEAAQPKVTVKSMTATPNKSPSNYAAGNKFDTKIEVTIQTTTGKVTTTGKMPMADVAKLNFTWDWKTNPTNPIADVTRNGDILTIVAVREGTDTLTLTEAESGVTCTISITVYPPVNAVGIKLNKTTTNLITGGTEVLVATLTGATAKDKPTDNVLWSSDNTAVATVDQNGLIRGLGKGRAVVSASISNSNGSFIANCEVWVFNDEYDIIISPDTVTLGEGGLYTVQYKTYRPIVTGGNVYIQWDTDNKDIAEVSSSGVIRAVGTLTDSSGNILKEAAITASVMVNNNVSGSSDIKVIVENRKSINLRLTNAVMFQGDKQPLDFTRLKDPVTNKDILPYVTGQQFIWELKGTSAAFIVDGKLQSGSSVTTAAIASAVPQIQAVGIGRTYISVKTSEGQQPIHTIEVVSVPKTIQGMKFYKGTTQTPANEITNLEGYGRVIEIVNDQTQQITTSEQDESGRIMTWTTLEVDQFRKIGKPVTDGNGLIPNVGMPVYDETDATGTVTATGLYDSDGAVRFPSGFTFADYQNLIKQQYLEKNSSILLAPNGLITPQNNKTGLAAVRVTPVRDGDTENEKLSDGSIIEWVNYWYAVVPLFVSSGGVTTVNSVITAEAHFILEEYDSANGWTRKGTGYVTAATSAALGLNYAAIAAGTQRITDANGNVLTSASTPNPEVRAVVNEANFDGSNVFYVWVQAKDVKIEFKGMTDTIVPSDRLLDASNPWPVTIDFSITPGSDDINNSSQMYDETNTDPHVNGYEYYIITKAEQLNSRTYMYLWPQVKTLMGGSNTGIGIQGVQRFNFTYSAFAQANITATGSYNITVSVTQLGNYGFAPVNNNNGQNIGRKPPKSSVAEGNQSFAVTKSAPVPVTGVTVNKTSLTLVAGATDNTLTATVMPLNASNKNVFWSSDNTSVATVDGGGVVTAVAVGTAKITATTDDGAKTASCTVTVTGVAVTGVTLDKASLNLTAGDTGTLTATITPANASNKSITWSSSDSNVATVGADGLVTAVKPGTATITATTADGNKTAQCNVTVTGIAVTGVSLDKMAIMLAPSGTATLTATLEPANATNKNVTWSSSNENIATVDDGGVVTAVADGDATITVTTVDGGHTAECEVKVVTTSVPLQNLSLSESTLSLNLTDETTGQFTVVFDPTNTTHKVYSLSSSDTMVATVGRNGLTVHVTAVGPGTTTITVEVDKYTAQGLYNGKETRTCEVTVLGVRLNTGGVSNMLVGGELSLAAYIGWPENATNTEVTWSSNDETIATVAANGTTGSGAPMAKVTAVGVGNATITVTVKADGGFEFTDSCNVEVIAAAAPMSLPLTMPVTLPAPSVPISSIAIKRTTATAIVGGTLTLPLEILPADAGGGIVWASSNEKAATVSQSGVVTAHAAGTAVITATADGLTSKCTVSVKAEPKRAVTSVTVSKTSAELAISKTLRLTATVRPTSANIKTLYWYSSDESVATVSQSGLVTAKSAGKAIIYAVTDDGGKTANCELTVLPKAEGIELEQTEVTVKRSKTLTLKATVLPENASNKTVTWKSSNTKIVTVDKNGKIKGVKAGTATITVTSKDGGFTATCVVTVEP